MGYQQHVAGQNNDIIEKLEMLAGLDVHKENQPFAVKFEAPTHVERMQKNQGSYTITFSDAQDGFADSLRLLSHLQQAGLTKEGEPEGLVNFSYNNKKMQGAEFALAGNISVKAGETMAFRFIPKENDEAKTLTKLDTAITLAQNAKREYKDSQQKDTLGKTSTR